MEKTFISYQTAFCKKDASVIRPAIRIITVDSSELTGIADEDLEKIYKYGQNCNQPSDTCYSTSIGDIIVYENKTYLVAPVGFIEKGTFPANNLPSSFIFDLENELLHPIVQENFGYLVK
ncbi:MAG: hypothetical protein WC979_02340 [Candidatus Pacearchaeota archaeon]|jgi:hypothetical protein|nr:hypothetical protein [Clostridia bacterium]